MGRLLVVFLGLISSIAAAVSNVVPKESIPVVPRVIFPLNSEMIYSWNVDISTGTSTPAGHISHYGIQTFVRIRTGSQLDGVEFRVVNDNFTFTAYNGDATAEKLPTCDCNPIVVEPVDLVSLASPFVVNYAGGKISDIQLENDELPWTRNIKRGIAQQFQIDLQQLKFSTKPEIFTSKESGLWGECNIENTVNPSWKKDSTYKLTKNIQSSQCPDKGFMWDDNLYLTGDISASKSKFPSETSTSRKISIAPQPNGEFEIKKISSNSNTNYQLSFKHGEVYFHMVKQTLRLLNTERNDLGVTPDRSMETFDMKAEMPAVYAPKPGSRADFTLGRGHEKPLHWEHMDRFMMSILGKIAQGLDDPPKVTTQTDPDNSHNMNLHLLLWHFRLYDMEQLKFFTNSILRGTSYREETIRNIFLDVLPLVGTPASAEQVKRLVVKDKVSKDQAKDMLDDLPSNLIGGDAKLLSDFKVLLDVDVNPPEDQEEKIRTEATLAFASLVGKVCGKRGVCNSALLDEYIRLFFKRFRDTDDYEEQVLNILALGNIGLGPVAEYLEPIVRGTLPENYSYRLRVLAASAAKSAFLARGPEKVYSIFWPIFADREEHLELRVLAVSYLMEAEPTSSRYLSILWLLKKENNPQLYNFFYTSVTALAATSNPLFYKMSFAAKRIARTLPVPAPRHVHTARYLIDLPSWVLGGDHVTAQVTTLADPNSGLMDLAYVNVLCYERGMHHSIISVYLRAEGVSELLDLAGSVDWANEGEKIIEIERLENLKIKYRELQSAHFEAVITSGGKATYFSVRKSTDKNVGNEVVKDTVAKVLKDTHRNLQMASLASSRQGASIDDFGLPLITDPATPGLISIRSNVSEIQTQNSIQYKFKLDMRVREDDGLMIRTYNPIGTLWHGVQRHSIHEMNIPIDFSFLVKQEDRSLTLKFDWEKDEPLFSSVHHVRTQTFVGGDYNLVKATLNKTCPTCTEDWRDASAAPRREKTLFKSKLLDQEIELEAALFECELPQNVEQWPNWIDQLFSNSKSEDIFYLEGNCGLKITAMPVGQATSLDVVFQLEQPVTKPVDEIKSLTIVATSTYRDSLGEPISLWGTTFKFGKSMTGENDIFSIGIHTMKQSNGDKRDKFEICYADRVSFTDGLDSTIDRAVWDFLYDSSPLRRNERKIKLSWGVDPSASLDSCPDQHQISLTGSSKAMERDTSVWPHSQCEADKGTSDIYPATAACGLSADYSYGDRNFTMNFKQRNVIPTQYRPWVKFPEGLTLDFTTRGPEVDSYTLTTAGSRSVHSVVESNAKPVLSYINLMLSYAYLGDDIVGYLTRGSGSRCTFAGDRVLTFDNSSVPVTLGNEWTLLAADCRAIPSFTVFVRKVDGVDGLAVRAHLLNDRLEITPVANGEEPDVNLTSIIPDGTPQLRMVKNGKSLLWRTEKRRMMDLSYSSAALTVRALMGLRGVTCGLCGDYDFTPEAPCSFKGPDGTHVSVENLVSAYTLKN